ncbi:MAG TPA: DUF3089 domain-containing protein [Solirubrobacteraceae bacterium]|nr:DUF3089 domain-containing protein [Solirubrobacteraceae bacterium]
MRQGWRSGALSAGRIARLLALAALAMFVVAGLSAGTAMAKKPPKTVWLCKPRLENDPCTEPLTATVVQTDGETSRQEAKIDKKAPIDCFYVYPTVSEQETENANLEIEATERQVAINQVSRFSQDCKVYAPMYPQITLTALKREEEGKPLSPTASIIAYEGVLSAFKEYLAKYNKGRGFVLIGHSQGSLMLEQLIKEQVEPNAAVSKQLVGAVLLGGNVLVPDGQLAGGTFQTVPACTAAAETHCVIAYSSFLKEPPEGAYFGRENSPLLAGDHEGEEVVCVNPALLAQNGGEGALLPYGYTTRFPGELGYVEQTPTEKEPGVKWIESPGEYNAQCHKENGASWLQINPVGTPVDPPEYVEESLGPDWGLHLYDVNIALGNLVKDVALESTSYSFES